MMSQDIPFFALDDTPASQSKNFGGAFSVFTLKGLSVLAIQLDRAK